MRKWTGLLLIFGVALAPALASAQDSTVSFDDAVRGYEGATHTQFQGIPEDWSTHHVVYSHATGSAPNDPRYWLQQIRAGLVAGEALGSVPLAVATAKARTKAKRDWSEDLGSGASVGNGQYPAKYSFATNGTPNCTSDYVVFNTGLAGSSGQASIVAYNELYKTTCIANPPATMWAYNTGGTVTLSPVLSLDGTQVAFVQTVSNVAYLVVLKWSSSSPGTVSSPVTLTSTSSYAGCTAPCMIALKFSGSPNDTTSAPFYDYNGTDDTLYVGDSTGKLHAFTPVFKSTTSKEPAEITTVFPVTVSQSSQPLADPVYDSNLGLVFVGDGHVQGNTDDGEVHAITASTGAMVNSASTCHGSGYLDGPLLDPSAQRIYFTCGHDVGGGECPTSGDDACIRQFSETAISGSSGTSEALGANLDAAVPPGAFDNIYLNSNNSTGDLYVCADPGGAPILYRVPITSNAISTPVTVATLSSSTTATCSPVTEFYNTTTTTDWLFVGPSADGSLTGCSGTTGAAGCIYSFNATSALGSSTAPSAGLAATGGPSGIVVDNIGAASSTTANVYYSTLTNQSCTTSGGTGGCAVQASQNNLD